MNGGDQTARKTASVGYTLLTRGLDAAQSLQRQSPGRISQRLDGHTHFVEQAQMQVRERRVRLVLHVTPPRTRRATGEEDRQVSGVM